MPEIAALQDEHDHEIDDQIASEIGDRTERLINGIKELDPSDAVEGVKRWTAENPLLAIGIAAGVGVAVGALLHAAISEDEVRQRDSAIGEMLRETGSQLVNRARDASSDVVADVQSRLHSVQVPSAPKIVKETRSLVDTLVSTLSTVFAQKIDDWIRHR